MSTNMSPEKFVEDHFLTKKLKRIGLTDEQLKSIHFRGNNEGVAFDSWWFTWAVDIPKAATPFLKGFCTLKWLILEDPPSSRDKDEAWVYLRALEIAPVIEADAKSKLAQQKRAQLPRGMLAEGGKTLRQVIENLLKKPESNGLRVYELWPIFFGVLDSHGLDPEESGNLRNLKECAYKYDFKDGRKRISYRRFANIVSDIRIKKSR